MYAMQEETARGPFVPTKVIVLAELSIREKEQYYQLMVANNCKFHKDGEGRFVGNVRLLSPNVRKIEHELKKKDSSNYSLTFQERLTRLKQEGFINVQIIAPEQIEYNGYPRFTALIAYNGDTVRPRPRPLAWVMKIVEDIYDYRFSHEKNDVQREDDSPSFDLMLLIFPVFVVRRLGTNCGLKSLVDQTCWDLLYNTHVYRRDYLELEVFARFLQEFYDHDDLLFFLYVRSVIAKVLHLSFKSRWAKSDGPGRQPRSLWMSYRESAHVARIVFGSENEDMLRDFMYLITPQMVGQKTATSDSRRIDITEYLHLSVVGYHQSQSRAKGHIAGGGQRMLVPIPGQLTPPIPVPMPDTLAGDVIGHDDGMHEHYEGEGDDDGRGGGEYDDDDDAYHGGSAHQHHHPHQQYHEGTDQDHYDPNNEEVLSQ